MVDFKKNHLIVAIVFLVLSIAIALLMIVCIKQYQSSQKGYNEYLLKTYHFVKFDKIKKYKSGIEYEVYVSEEEKPLLIENLSSKAVNENLLMQINPGNTIQCYVTNAHENHYSYEVIELKENHLMILSLDEYNRQHRSNSIVGFVVISCFSLLALSVSIFNFVTFKKKKGDDRGNIANFMINQWNQIESKKSHLAKEKINHINQLACHFLTNPTTGLKGDKEEIHEKFEKSFYEKNNQYYTTALEEILNEDYGNVLNEVIYNQLNDGEFRVIYDDCLIDHSAAFITYKYHNQLLNVYIFINEITQKFDVDENALYFCYPNEKNINQNAMIAFGNAVKEYNKAHEDIIDFHSRRLRKVR